MSKSPRILLAINDENEQQLISRIISSEFPQAFQKIVEFVGLQSELTAGSFDILLLDGQHPDLQSLDSIILEITSNYPDLLLVTIIPEHREDLERTVIEHDIFFYISTPISPPELTLGLKRAITKRAHRIAGKNRQNSETAPPHFPGFIGECRPMRNLFELIHRVAADDFSTVLIRGESGTGKELVAKAIHSRSRRRNNNFVPVNCAAIPDELLESELFGHMKGSFTGASQNKQGRIQYADGGTLFLDEIGDMKPVLQAKLLRVLQEKEFEPVGSLKATPVDTRIVAATHCNLEELVNQGTFREDLYYRLSVIPLEVPPLRKRPEDIPLLLDEFIQIYTTRRGRPRIVFTPESVAVLMNYQWRGNVRELENLVQHMSILYSGRHIQPDELPDKFTMDVDLSTLSPPPAKRQLEADSINDNIRERSELLAASISPVPSIDLDDGPINFNDLINEFESELIIKAMRMTSGNKKEAARMLNLKRTTLLEKIKKKDLNGLWEE